MTQRNIRFIDLPAQQQRIRAAIDQRIQKVLDHGQYIMGPEVAELEKGLAAYAGVKHALVCASGTDALLMALMAYGVKPGDAVITTAFTFIATAEVVSLLGATPVFVDIDPKTYNIDPKLVPAAIEKAEKMGLRPRGIIPVDLFGLPADFDMLTAIAQQHQLFILDDACQGFGGMYIGKRIGGLGGICATSFFPAKPLGCYGDGGAVFTNNDRLADIMASIRIHGKGTDQYDNIRIGINGRLDTIQCAILLEKLAIFEEEILKRQEVAAAYTKRLKGTVTTPYIPQGMRSAWAQYSVLHDRRDAIIAALKAEGIPAMVYYPKPLHLQTAFADLGYKQGDLPVCESVSKKVFSLPMHPYLPKDDIDYISAAVIKAAK